MSMGHLKVLQEINTLVVSPCWRLYADENSREDRKGKHEIYKNEKECIEMIIAKGCFVSHALIP